MFDLIPNINYDGTIVKNFFRKVKLRDDAFQYSTIFKTYTVKDGETPQDVSFKFYQNINYYWIILLVNDIQNINTDWGMSSIIFEDYIKQKYPSDLGETTRHWETKSVVVGGVEVLPEGNIVDEDYSFVYLGQEYTNITRPVTFRTWEVIQNEAKKKIFVLKDSYISKYENEFKTLLT